MHNTFFCFAKYSKQLTRHCMFFLIGVVHWKCFLSEIILIIQEPGGLMKFPFITVSHFRSLLYFNQMTTINTLGKNSRMGTASDLFNLCSNMSVSRSDWWSKSNSYGQLSWVAGLVGRREWSAQIRWEVLSKCQHHSQRKQVCKSPSKRSIKGGVFDSPLIVQMNPLLH